MHVLTPAQHGIDSGEQAVDLQQDPGEIVILSAADTEIAALVRAVSVLKAPPHTGEFPFSVRVACLADLAHPLSVDLYVEKTLSKARVIFLRLLGGKAYWPYLLERTRATARAAGALLFVVPGEAHWDSVLAEEGTVAPLIQKEIWNYFVQGGVENLIQALRLLGGLLLSPPEGTDSPNALPSPSPRPPLIMPPAGLWKPALGKGTPPFSFATIEEVRALWPGDRSPIAAMVFYRALIQSGMEAPLEALWDALLAQGLAPLPLFVTSLKDRESCAVLAHFFDQCPPDIVLNATAFSVSKTEGPSEGTILERSASMVLQTVFASSNREVWESGKNGLGLRDLTMHVVLPEIDGRVFTRAVSFKERDAYDPQTQTRPLRFVPQPDRIHFVAALAEAWTSLRRRPASERRVALILPNAPARDGRLANGVGLDTPASAVEILKMLKESGYTVTTPPDSSATLMAQLLSGPTNMLPQEGDPPRISENPLSLDLYKQYFVTLPRPVQEQTVARWGSPESDPMQREGAFHLALHRYGHVVVGLQPARGTQRDPRASYHDLELAPPHAYFAFYFWLRHIFNLHAVVHVGKHGTLEWLPGKAVALSENCAAEAVLGPLPHLYPFIVNDPGEGTQAKRRSAAVILDHLTPPLTRAESHGAALELETLLDEYALAKGLDPRRMRALEERIFNLSARHGLDLECGFTQEACRTEEGRLASLARLDAHLCDLKELQIRDGLHIFGQSPSGVQARDLLCGILRVPRGGDARSDSLLRALGADLGLSEGGFDPLNCSFAKPWTGPFPSALTELKKDLWRNCGDTVERLEALAAQLVESGVVPAAWTRTQAVFETLTQQLKPALAQCGIQERTSLLAGLSGHFVPSGPSGAPTRGRPEVLPTGRNFYSVDIRAIPTPTAWALGVQSAERMVERYFEEEGTWPRAIALSAWGTSTMRTGGDDIAQALALIGARPIWESSGRVTGVEVISSSELRRPRVDVTLRISGFFRDAFPAQIDLFDSAVRIIADLSESEDANPLAARIRSETQSLCQTGLSSEAAKRHASYRIFGAAPGSYGTGLQTLIEESAWEESADLAEAFLEWGQTAYGSGKAFPKARSLLETRLQKIDAVLHNQDNREHDLLDSDDYYQFEGGLCVTVATLKGAPPRVFHTDHSRPERPIVRSLEEEISRVVRARAANPKWIAGVMRHGYKGAFEIAATVDYLFAFAATTSVVRAHHFDQLYEAYLENAMVRDFIREVNPPALKEIAARFQEAIRRNLWMPRRNSVHGTLEMLLEKKEDK